MLEHILLLWKVQFQNKISSQSFLDYIPFLKGKMQAYEEMITMRTRARARVCVCVCVCVHELLNLGAWWQIFKKFGTNRPLDATPML